MKNVAVLLAGGVGNRSQSAVPKQFVKINNKPLITYSLQAFQQHTEIDEILIVLPHEYVSIYTQYFDLNSYSKVVAVIAGGKERYESSWAAICYYKSQQVNLILHDVARPLVSQTVISKVIAALRNYQAVCTILPVVDTIVELENNTSIRHYPSRKDCFMVQTPQAFSINLLQSAYKQLFQTSDINVTDDCSVVHRFFPNEIISFVEGEKQNFKVTFPEDFALVEYFLHLSY